jgi:hypothetical protein
MPCRARCKYSALSLRGTARHDRMLQIRFDGQPQVALLLSRVPRAFVRRWTDKAQLISAVDDGAVDPTVACFMFTFIGVSGDPPVLTCCGQEYLCPRGLIVCSAAAAA